MIGRWGESLACETFQRFWSLCFIIKLASKLGVALLVLGTTSLEQHRLQRDPWAQVSIGSWRWSRGTHPWVFLSSWEAYKLILVINLSCSSFWTSRLKLVSGSFPEPAAKMKKNNVSLSKGNLDKRWTQLLLIWCLHQGSSGHAWSFSSQVTLINNDQKEASSHADGPVLLVRASIFSRFCQCSTLPSSGIRHAFAMVA